LHPNKQRHIIPTIGYRKIAIGTISIKESKMMEFRSKIASCPIICIIRGVSSASTTGERDSQGRLTFCVGLISTTDSDEVKAELGRKISDIEFIEEE
jgi:hypothetical protein